MQASPNTGYTLSERQRKAAARQKRVQRQRQKERAAIFRPTPVRYLKLPFNLSFLRFALIVSALIHLVFLSIHFEPELKALTNRQPVLEVTLVNTKTLSKPKDANTFAQVNLDRGGNTYKNKRLKSPLPATKPNTNDTKINSSLIEKNNQQSSSKLSDDNLTEAELAKLKALEHQAQALMIQLKSNIAAEKSNHQKNKDKAVAKKSGASKANQKQAKLSKKALEMQRLEALIAKEYEAYQKRPKRKFIGARAKEYKYAQYVDNWRQRVEKIGNDNYPTAAKKLKLYGKLQMTVSIKKDGTIEKIELDRSSGYRVLDAAARRILALSAPFAPFPAEIQKEIDILSITRTWSFTKESGLITQID